MEETIGLLMGAHDFDGVRVLKWKQHWRNKDFVEYTNDEAEGPSTYTQFFCWVRNNGLAHHSSWTLGRRRPFRGEICRGCGVVIYDTISTYKNPDMWNLCDECYAGAGPPPQWMIERLGRELRYLSVAEGKLFDKEGRITAAGEWVQPVTSMGGGDLY